jgi:DNA primase
MRFTPEFLDELRARVPLAEVVGRKVQLKKRGRNHTGLCPFHREKTPSFTVHEDKGFYHCFGCQASGDVIDFVMKTENLTFPEAVERLAGMAGMRLPEAGPRDAEHQREYKDINAALEAAARWFAAQLASPAGAGAREYLAGRGLDAKAVARFRLGFAPERRGALKSALMETASQKDGRFPEKLLIAAGLLAVPEGGGETFDRFRGRIVFPIADRRGRVIGFGGRGLGDVKPKYLNSPETALFHKGRTLYNLAGALPAARERGEVIVAEGYIDVIALDQAGYPNAVAPLGTALTEDQMNELWRLCDEPYLCFDGDEAGLRAAGAAAERALPLLKPGKSLRFVMLPGGEDPDSLLRKEGPEAIAKAVEAAWPLSRMIWAIETTGRPLDTPERRAQLRQSLGRRSAAIQDANVREEYRRDLERRFDELFPPRAAGPWRGGRGRPPPGPGYAAPTMPRGQGALTRVAGQEILPQTLLAAVINHPELLDEVGEDLGLAEFLAPELDRLRQAVVEAAGIPGLDTERLKSHLRDQGFSGELRSVLRAEVYQHSAFARPEAALDTVRQGWKEAFGKHQLPILHAQVREAEQAVAREMTPENQRRFYDLKKRLYELELKAREWIG